MAEWVTRWCQIGDSADDWGEGYYQVLAGQVILDRLAVTQTPMGYYRIMAWLRNGHLVEFLGQERRGGWEWIVLVDKSERRKDWETTWAANCMVWGWEQYPEVQIERQDTPGHMRHWVIQQGERL